MRTPCLRKKRQDQASEPDDSASAQNPVLTAASRRHLGVSPEVKDPNAWVPGKASDLSSDLDDFIASEEEGSSDQQDKYEVESDSDSNPSLRTLNRNSVKAKAKKRRLFK